MTFDATTPEAKITRWRKVVAAEPANRVARMRLAECLAAAGQEAELIALADQTASHNPGLTEAVLDIACLGLPQAPRLALAACRLADSLHPPPTRHLRWLLAHRRFPDHAEIAAGYAAARAIMAEGTTPRAAPPGGESPGFSDQMQYWRQARELHPDKREYVLGYVECLTRHHRFTEAIAELTAAGAAGDPGLLELLAIVAEQAWDWPLARQCLASLVRASPDRADLAARLVTADREIAAAAARRLPQGRIIPPPATLPKAADAQALHDLLRQFESLGANCEFGLLQRRFGAEPLGLLRFAATRPRTLLILLRSEFEGVGDPAAMTLLTNPRDFRLRHESSRLTLHTRLRPGPDTEPQAVFARQCRHITFLRGKLLRDLREARKIFVYFRPRLADTDIDDIYAGLATYGPNRLLCLRLADAAHPPGFVEWRTPRLMIGAIDRQGRGNEEAGWDISVPYWAYFCHLARQMG